MNRYKNLHRWMFVPMLFMQLGIFSDYWGDFSDNAWSVHIHYWTGTIWYIYLIIQPYYATHGQLDKHRTNGIIGMFMAGGVGLTAFSMMYRDLQNAQNATANPERFGPFQPWFFYAVAAVEVVMIMAFIFAVIQSIIKRKELENHACWLISSVFIIMMPALGRGIQNVWVMAIGFGPDANIMDPIYLTEFLIIIMILWSAKNYGQLKHPATYLAVAVNLLNCFMIPIGKSQQVQDTLNWLIRG